MFDRACETSRYNLPTIEPESSIKSVVSKVARKEYRSSPPRVASVCLNVAASAASGAGSSEGWVARFGPDAAVGDKVYASGGLLDGTVKAFILGRSGRRVAGDGLARGLGLLRKPTLSGENGFRSARPRNVGVVGVVGV
jgi:hypothetical protein